MTPPVPDAAPDGSDHPARTPAPRVGVAMAATASAMAVGRAVADVSAPPELAFEAVARFLGVPAVFNAVHALPFGLDRAAKPVLFLLVAGVWLAAAWFLGRRIRPWTRRFGRWPVVALFGCFSLALTALVLFPAQGLGAFGLSPANVRWDPWTSHVAAFLYGALFAGIAGSRAQRDGVDAGRRRAVSLLARLGLVVAAGALGAGRFVTARAQEGADLFARLIGIEPPITPVPEHYVVSKNLFDPNVRERGWSLRITGLVETPLELRLDDLRNLPSVTRPTTLICVSNPVGGDLIGNSEWTGVRLSDLLELAGPAPAAREVVLRAADNYSDSFPLDAAMREGTIVAYLQNGEPLTSRHGFPARVLVPGIYGMKNVKWVEEISLAESDHLGYWQTRGWSDEAIVKTMSRIDTDVAVRLGDGRVAIGGVAFAGLRGVRSVEVSLDGGARWWPAELEPAPNAWSWVRWAAVVEPEDERFEVRVRATDGTGTVQTADRSPPLPDGAAGHHTSTVRVEA